ncbi:acyloxyacyl hydrolase [Marivita sp. GX14005]|uniref:acyloxyacyl hydrolase n=1 Tax=Marivita sp. GX14005 TaxID=2942276 RepID=UPI00201853E6|nr:acyloxyacyl hydrolase [Marivita sp. GX14005]MCL3883393.1 acyloxyacyl hydrolase [Marivita sp. GX14005]
MADGTFAALLLIAGLTDMGMSHCGTDEGCLGRSEVTPRLSISGGQVLERQADAAAEVYLRYDTRTKFGPFGTAAGLSLGENGETWIGYGATYAHFFGQSGAYAELHAMPGLYFDNGGFDLGGEVAFRSGLELGYETVRGWRVALSYDHRSNAGLYDENPGVETVQLKLSIPLN